MIKSLRGMLLAWYALILAVVIAGFGASLYFSADRAARHEVDAALRSHLTALAACVTIEQGAPRALVPAEYGRQFPREGKHASYFSVRDASGQLLAASRDDLDLPPPERSQPPGPHRERPWPYDRDLFREMNMLGPGDTILTVGQRVEEDQRRLQQLLATIIAAGGASWLVALAGGWFLAGRLLAPIAKMSSTAASISAGQLSQRIDTAAIHNELGQLGVVLNGAFDRLEQAYEEQARFTADASHELRTPLAVMLSSASLALKRERSPQEYRQALETNLQAGERLHQLVERMLTLARADAERSAPREEPIELHELVAAECEFVRPLAEEKQVALLTRLDEIQMLGDEYSLRQITANLLSNALRYTPQGGRIEVSLTVGEQIVELRVSDTGIGIPADELPRVFDRFYCVDKARSRSQGGAGLGLSIVQTLVESLGGEVSCASAEGQGTTFLVRLPLRRAT
jgi:heavy metal sensor kinase